MKSGDVTKLVVALALLGSAGGVAYWASTRPGPVGMMESYSFQCNSEKCREVFSRTKDELLQANRDRVDIPCPKCNSVDIVRGSLCPGCKGFVKPIGHGQVPKSCPHCKASMMGGAGAGGGS